MSPLYVSRMPGNSSDSLYRAFGEMVRRNRELHPGLTQEKFGKLVGLSRTSVVNIEKGRQHIALHQLFVFAAVLKVRPDALLPSPIDGAGSSSIAQKLPPGTDKPLTAWAEKLFAK